MGAVGYRDVVGFVARRLLPPSPSAKLFEEARLARDHRQWGRAVEKYVAALAQDSSRADMVLQLANCQKEHRAFSQSLGTYQSIKVPRYYAEVRLQLGHLMKVTGNFWAARCFYTDAAEAGNTDAAHELNQIEVLSKDALRIDVDGIYGMILECEKTLVPSARLLRSAAAMLLSLDRPDIAKTFCEAAYLFRSSWENGRDHARMAAATKLWREEHEAALDQGEDPILDHDAQIRLEGLAHIARRLSAEKEVVGRTSVPVRPIDDAVVRLVWQEAPGRLAALASLINRLYNMSFDPAGGAALEVLVSELRQAVPLAPIVFIEDEDGTVARVIDVAGDEAILSAITYKVLANVTMQWLALVESRYLSDHASAAMRDALARSGGNPLVERSLKLKSFAAGMKELIAIQRRLAAADESEDDGQLDRAVAICMAAMAADMARGNLMSARRAAQESNLSGTTQLLEAEIERRRRYGDRSASEDEVAALMLAVERIRQAGRLKRAYELVEGLFETKQKPRILRALALIASKAGDFEAAVRLLRRCLDMEPDSMALRHELLAVLPETMSVRDALTRFEDDELFLECARGNAAFRIVMDGLDGGGTVSKTYERSYANIAIADQGLSPELTRYYGLPIPGEWREEFHLIQCGWLRRSTPMGELPMLRSYDFIRARILSRGPVEGLRVRLDGRTIAWSIGGSPTIFRGMNQVYFTCWLDLSDVSPGLHELQIVGEQQGDDSPVIRQAVWIDPVPLEPGQLELGAALDLGQAPTEGSLTERINGLPSEIFSARRMLFDGPIENILVVRADQLGDVIVSIQAILKLREIFPRARFNALVSMAAKEFVESLGIFDEVFVINLPYDLRNRRRYMPVEDQEKLREQLLPRHFDLAVDLSGAYGSRFLLKLSGARNTVGFDPDQFPWLTLGVRYRTHDAVNGHERMPPAAGISVLVEAVAEMARYEPAVVRRELDWGLLTSYGIGRDEAFFVIHAGARTATRRWSLQNYAELTRMLIAEFGHKVVMIVDTTEDLDGIDLSAIDRDRFTVIAGQIRFDEFDAMLVHCTAFIGNDTGPKHLAALRGAKVVSLQVGALNWREWGHSGPGLIVTRRVPCCGCGIENEDECGIGVPCLTNIKPHEVFKAVTMLVKSEVV